jgi:hypothetical protein
MNPALYGEATWVFPISNETRLDSLHMLRGLILQYDEDFETDWKRFATLFGRFFVTFFGKRSKAI